MSQRVSRVDCVIDNQNVSEAVERRKIRAHRTGVSLRGTGSPNAIRGFTPFNLEPAKLRGHALGQVAQKSPDAQFSLYYCPRPLYLDASHNRRRRHVYRQRRRHIVPSCCNAHDKVHGAILLYLLRKHCTHIVKSRGIISDDSWPKYRSRPKVGHRTGHVVNRAPRHIARSS